MLEPPGCADMPLRNIFTHGSHLTIHRTVGLMDY